MGLLQDFGVLAILLAIFAAALHRGQSEEDVRALTFTALVMARIDPGREPSSPFRERQILPCGG
jgi:hypothetical protein